MQAYHSSCYFFLLSMGLILFQPVLAEKQGWHWYFNPLEENPEPPVIEQPKEPLVELKAEPDPLQELEAIQVELKMRRAQAVLNPTPDNIVRYIKYQKEMVLDKASYFAEQYRRLVWMIPELNYQLQRPVNHSAKQLWSQQQDFKVDEALKQLSQQWGVFFFFRSDCPYCHKFAPMVQLLKEQYGFTVMAVSLDGKPIPGFPNPMIDQGQFSHINQGQSVVPALVAVDPKTGRVQPISYGLVSLEGLKQRLFKLTQAQLAMDY